MYQHLLLSLAGTALLLGCSSQPPLFSDAANGPASTQATEAPLPPQSKTLVIERSTDARTPPGSTPGTSEQMPGMMHMDHNTGGANQSTPPATTTAVLYTCSMHPQIVSDHPGTCPICGMTLVKKESH